MKKARCPVCGSPYRERRYHLRGNTRSCVHPWHDGRTIPEPSAPDNLKTRTKEEAWALHAKSEQRGRLLKEFRETAVRMLKQTRNSMPLNTRLVREQMVKEGTYVDVGSDTWMCSAFARDPRFVPIDLTHECQPPDYKASNRQTGRKSHGGALLAKFWVLRDLADGTEALCT